MALPGVPDTMLAARLIQVPTPSSHPQSPVSTKATDPRQFEGPYNIRQIQTPRNLGQHDLLLKVSVASYCHTDGMVRAGLMGTPLPCIPSHEGTGTVVCAGDAVSGFKKGDRVMAGLPRERCGHCPDCLGPEENQHYCPNVKGYVGVTLDGAFAEYMIVDSRESCVVPDKVSFETAAPLACAGCTIFKGILQTELKKGETVGIVGAGGGLGHLGVQFAKALGLVVVGIDAREEGLALARECRERGSASGLACAVTRMHGTVVQIAQPPEVSIPYAELIFRDIRIKGSLICTRSEAQRMLQVVAEHRISVRTNPFFGLNEIPKLLELVHSGKMAGKGTVIVDEEEQKRVRAGKIPNV